MVRASAALLLAQVGSPRQLPDDTEVEAVNLV